MNYSVKPEIKHKPKEVEEKFMVWEAGGRVLVITTKDDAELIVRALNHDELFDDIVSLLRPFAALLAKHMHHERDNKPVFAVNDARITIGELRKARNFLTKIDKEKEIKEIEE